MATKKTLTVTLPNGSKACRKTARNYTHALCLQDKAWAWAGSFELAQKRLQSVHPGVQAITTIVAVDA